MYNPQFAAIGNKTAWNTLFGTPESTQMRTVWDGQKYVQKSVKNPATAGLLDIYQKAGNRMANFNRQQTLADLNFAPQALQSYIGANPLLGSIVNRAQQGLDQGGALDSSTRRALEQASIGDASMRGFGHSPLDAFMAYSSLGAEAEARKRQREQFALQTQSMLPDPFSLSRNPSFATTMGPAIGMQGAQFGRQAAMPVINPFGFNQNQQMPSDNTTSNILGAISGGLLNMAGGMGGMGGLGAGAGRSNPSGNVTGPGGYNYAPAQGNYGTYYKPV